MGQRGPKPLPANVHLLHGNPSKKSLAELYEGIHPEVVIPKCPPHLQAEARKEYKRVSVELESLGLISQIDRAALAAYCSAWAEYAFCEKKIADLNAADPDGEKGYVTTTPSGYQQMSIWVTIRNRALYLMKNFGAEFGMSPSSRSRVSQSENRQQQLFPEAAGSAWEQI
jgi:P27 family predicted phage terminase small subunit